LSWPALQPFEGVEGTRKTRRLRTEKAFDYIKYSHGRQGEGEKGRTGLIQLRKKKVPQWRTIQGLPQRDPTQKKEIEQGKREAGERGKVASDASRDEAYL